MYCIPYKEHVFGLQLIRFLLFMGELNVLYFVIVIIIVVIINGLITALCYYNDIIDAPVFTEGNDIVNRSVVIGNDITLSCDVMATPTNDLTLSYSTSESNVVITDDTFVITSINNNNNGWYTCTAENEVGIRQLSYNVIVKG